jgi:hypothetical protein
VPGAARLTFQISADDRKRSAAFIVASEKSTDAVQATIEPDCIRYQWRKTTNMQCGTRSRTNTASSILSTKVERSCSNMFGEGQCEETERMIQKVHNTDSRAGIDRAAKMWRDILIIAL